MNGNAHNGSTNGHHTSPNNQQNGNTPGATSLVDTGNELANRFSGMLSTQIKSTMDYATVKAAETKSFVQKRVNGMCLHQFHGNDVPEVKLMTWSSETVVRGTLECH